MNPQTISGARVLVVDDSETIRACAQMFLRRAGCEVFVVKDGVEALEKIADYRPDVIFMDVFMPRLNGYQTCSQIRKGDSCRDVPIVMLSACDGAADRDRGVEAGASAYLTKPFSRGGLLQTVAAYMPPGEACHERDGFPPATAAPAFA